MVDTGVAIGANMSGCYCYWLLEQLSPEQDHLSVRAHWHKVSLFHFTPRFLVAGMCAVFLFWLLAFWGVFLWFGLLSQVAS